MALCCDVNVGKCINGHDSLVHLERVDGKQTGWGCIECKTAQEFKIKCIVEGCSTINIRYAANKSSLQKSHAKCDVHYSKPPKEILALGTKLLEGKFYERKKSKTNKKAR